MPKVKLNNRDREIRLFSDYVRGQLRREKKKQEELADFLGIPRPSLSCRLSGKSEWKLSEMADVCQFFEKPWTVGERYG